MNCVNSNFKCLSFLFEKNKEKCVVISNCFNVNLDLSLNNSGSFETRCYAQDGLDTNHLLASWLHYFEFLFEYLTSY